MLHITNIKLTKTFSITTNQYLAIQGYNEKTYLRHQKKKRLDKTFRLCFVKGNETEATIPPGHRL